MRITPPNTHRNLFPIGHFTRTPAPGPGASSPMESHPDGQSAAEVRSVNTDEILTDTQRHATDSLAAEVALLTSLSN